MLDAHDNDGSGGNTTQNDTNDTNDSQNDSGTNDAARLADFQSQLKRHQGDALRYAEKLHDRNYALRQRAQAAEAQVPADGTIVLSAADAKAFKEYQALGSVSDLTEGRTRLTQLEQFQMVSNAAGVIGMNPKVLSKLLPSGAKLEVGEATDENGEAKRIVNIVVGEDQPTNLEVYANQNWKDFLPALRAGSDDQSSGGTQWIQQQGSSSSGAKDKVNPILQQKIDQMRKRAEPASAN